MYSWSLLLCPMSGYSSEILADVLLAMLLSWFQEVFRAKVVRSHVDFLDERIEWLNNVNSGIGLYERRV
jgi:hypothetical protein